MTAQQTGLAPDASGCRAAPAGGAFGCRGCSIVFALWLCLAGAVCANTDAETEVDLVPVPSGLEVVFHDMLWDEPGNGLTYRFRFVAEMIGQDGWGFIEVSDDMAHLCSDYALPRISEIGPQPSHVIITLMSQPTEFGVANPEVTQFFESYTIEDGLCIWEIF